MDKTAFRGLLQSVTAKLFDAGLLFVYIVVALVRPASAQSQWREDKLPDTSDGLKLSVSLDQPTYRLNDVATATIKLTNVTQEPITIYNKFGYGWSSSFFWVITDKSGMGMPRRFLPDHLPYPHFEPDDFSTIQPEEFVEQELDLDIRDEAISRVGQYTLTVWYRCPVPESFAPNGLKIWPWENGRLETQAKFLVVK